MNRVPTAAIRGELSRPRCAGTGASGARNRPGGEGAVRSRPRAVKYLFAVWCGAGV